MVYSKNVHWISLEITNNLISELNPSQNNQFLSGYTFQWSQCSIHRRTLVITLTNPFCTLYLCVNSCFIYELYILIKSKEKYLKIQITIKRRKKVQIGSIKKAINKNLIEIQWMKTFNYFPFICICCYIFRK